jgi:hypothetical protein
MQVMKIQIRRILIVSVIAASLFSFLQDLVYFDYGRPGVILTQEEEKKLDNLPLKDVKKYIDDHTREHSAIESIEYILSRYRYPSTWKQKLKPFALYFFAVFLGCLLAGVNLRKQELP